MNKIFDQLGLSNMSNEEIILAINELENEKKRRAKVDRRNSAIEFRQALEKFINSGAYADFEGTCSVSPYDIEFVLGCDCQWEEDDVDAVEISIFDRDILLCMKNELTQQIGNYEG